VRTPAYLLFVDGEKVVDVVDDRVDATNSALSMTATGTTGVIALIELRVHDAP
jgi:hypothetical protein